MLCEWFKCIMSRLITTTKSGRLVRMSPKHRWEGWDCERVTCSQLTVAVWKPYFQNPKTAWLEMPVAGASGHRWGELLPSIPLFVQFPWGFRLGHMWNRPLDSMAFPFDPCFLKELEPSFPWFTAPIDNQYTTPAHLAITWLWVTSGIKRDRSALFLKYLASIKLHKAFWHISTLAFGISTQQNYTTQNKTLFA